MDSKRQRTRPYPAEVRGRAGQSSCVRRAAIAVRLELPALASNRATVLRTLATPEAIETRSPTSPRERLVKSGARLR